MELTMKALQDQIDVLKKEINALKGNNSKNMNKLPTGLSIGDEFQLAGTTWKIMDITDTGYMCLAESIGNKKFDSDDNNWTTSKLRSYLNKEFLEKLEEEIGEGNVLGFERNLLSLDGQTEYGSCTDKVSLLTVDEYRKHRKLIPNTDDWFWLISPWSTPCNGFKKSVAVVAPAGNFDYLDCDCSGGVRPFCIFSSAIFESEEK